MATDAEAVRLIAEQELGDNAVAATTVPVAAAIPATGARAILAAAEVAKISVDAQ